EGEGGIGENGHVREGAALRLPVKEVGGRYDVVGGAALAEIRFPHHHELVWFAGGQRTEQKVIGEGEDGDARADAEGKREDGGGGKGGIALKAAQGVAEVGSSGLKEHERRRVAHGFGGGVEAAEVEGGVAPGFGFGHAAAQAIGDVEFEVGLKLGGEFAFAGAV